MYINRGITNRISLVITDFYDGYVCMTVRHDRITDCIIYFCYDIIQAYSTIGWMTYIILGSELLPDLIESSKARIQEIKNVPYLPRFSRSCIYSTYNNKYSIKTKLKHYK